MFKKQIKSLFFTIFLASASVLLFSTHLFSGYPRIVPGFKGNQITMVGKVCSSPTEAFDSFTQAIQKTEQSLNSIIAQHLENNNSSLLAELRNLKKQLTILKEQQEIVRNSQEFQDAQKKIE